ncbi:MAG: Glycosyl transferase group 1 [Candidatus Peregrinibacteria bacterium GW2011_GWA2_44_7]|nr:MAG: Glycosyl transferase group 1 [Candidatus Peregrinibacteria bacterium GW2011_GWA2_44_7]
MITCDGGIAYGKQNVFYEMLKDFAPHFKRVNIICPSNEKGEEIQIHDNVYLYPSPYSKVLHSDVFRHKRFVVKKGMEIFRKHGFDLIDAHFLPPLMSQIRGGEELAKRTKKPLIAEFMHLPGLPKASGIREWIEKRISLVFLKRYQKKLSHFRIINEREIGQLLKKKLGFRADQLHFISSIYLDFDYFKPLNQKREKGLFVVAGRLAQNKGLPLIIEAVRLVKAQGYSDVKLKIVGEGELRKELEVFIRKTGLEREIELLGWLPTQADVAELYNRAQASLMASFNEGGPRVVFESMACETPVLTRGKRQRKPCSRGKKRKF